MYNVELLKLNYGIFHRQNFSMRLNYETTQIGMLHHLYIIIKKAMRLFRPF